MRDSLALKICAAAALALTGCPDEAGSDDGGPSGGTDTATETEGEASMTAPSSGDTEVDTESGSDTDTIPPEGCDIPEYEDDIVLRTGDGTNVPGTAHRIVAHGGTVMTCGDGFFTFGGSVLEDAALAGACTGLAPAGDGHALVATAAGQVSLIAVGGGDPTLASTTADGGDSFHDVVGTATDAWVAAGTDGVIHYAIAADALGAADPIPGASDARGIAMVGDALLVADGFELGDIDDPTVGGAAVRLIDSAGGGMVAETLTGPGVATRPFVADGRAVVLRPGMGVDVFDVDASSLSLRYSTFFGEALVDAAFDGDDMLVAAGSRLLRVSLGDDDAALVSAEDRPERGSVNGAWFRAVAFAQGEFVAGIGDSVVPVELGSGAAAPEITLVASTMTMAPTQTEALFTFDNTGDETLIVTGVEIEAPFTAEIATDLNDERPGCPGQYEVEPASSLLFYARIDGADGQTERVVRVISNDADEPELEAVIEIGRPPPEVGDSAEDFHLLDVEGRDIDLSAYLGKVVLAKLYNPL